MKQAWKKYLLYGSIIVIGVVLALILLEIIMAKKTGFETKTLWDWMELLVIPLVLAGGAFLLNRSERNLEREIAADRQQEAALQAYLDRMAELLLQEKPLTPKNAPMWNVARVRTLTLMRELSATRNGVVLRFLRDIGLVDDIKQKGKEPSNFFVSTNLEGVVLTRVDLRDANLEGANLEGASLRDANLQDAHVSHRALKHARSFKGLTLPDGTKHDKLGKPPYF